ncbi:putative membrane protein [Actinoplanes lutulentus]|uniref:Fusaric acid resistance family protein n=1 Tax=Actinoplanes lutulentus TaxID=1287878 RepID=A0A327Z3A1_9ACTN|nr:FUSC family protein [Actinoplanes lutulentus]MBB2946364.1 putative membrane protein [Actinoplanes lutulentus]RAK28696.1 fusaric acid resistance family protein [Actinoplanes lutulentus]
MKPTDLRNLLAAAGPTAVRVGVSVAVPLLVVLALGHPRWSVYAAFGAFTSLYGRNHVHLSRLVMQASAGAALVSCVVLGVLVGAHPQRAWLAVVVAALVAGAGNLIASAEDWHPPGPLFLLFAFGAVSSAPHRIADLPAAAGVAAASAGFALLLGNATAKMRKPRDPRRARLRPDLGSSARYGIAALLAGAAATAFGIGHSYWATLAAVAPLSVPGTNAQLVRVWHRIAGTLAGLVVAAAVLAPGFGPYPSVLILVLLQVITELVIGRHYGLAMVAITPMALLMSQVAAPRPVGPLLWDRGIETAVGAAVASVVILVSWWWPRQGN